jgi:hypothetical protein
LFESRSPMGEGTPSQRPRRDSLSHWERAGVRGNALWIGQPVAIML